MKITDVIPHVIKPGLPGDTPDQSAWAFIEIRTDEGITGWGEATKYGRGGGFLIGQAVHMVKDDFIGREPGYNPGQQIPGDRPGLSNPPSSGCTNSEDHS